MIMYLRNAGGDIIPPSDFDETASQKFQVLAVSADYSTIKEGEHTDAFWTPGELNIHKGQSVHTPAPDESPKDVQKKTIKSI